MLSSRNGPLLVVLGRAGSARPLRMPIDVSPCRSSAVFMGFAAGGGGVGVGVGLGGGVCESRPTLPGAGAGALVGGSEKAAVAGAGLFPRI